MRLRDRVHLQRNEPTQDAAGQLVENWVTYRECYAKIQDAKARGREVDQFQKKTAIARVDVVIRYPQDGNMVDAADRVYFREGECVRTLNVEGVHRMDEERRYLKLECTETQDG